MAARQAPDLICRGFAAEGPVLAEGKLRGVQLRDVGLAKDGRQKETYEPGAGWVRTRGLGGLEQAWMEFLVEEDEEGVEA